MRRASLSLVLLVFGCSRLSVLTPDSLNAAQKQWESSGASNYRMVVETKGDRFDPSQYEVTVRAKEVVKLLRNGQLVRPGGGGEDYSVDGLFHVLDQELDLKQNPEKLGAPPGYASYPMADFDPATGRLLRYQRSVGGTKNSIEIIVKEFEVLSE